MKWIIGKVSTDDTVIRDFNMIQIKRLLSKYNKFSTINLDQKGEITLIVGFENVNNANFSDIKNVVDNARELIEDINKIDFRINRSNSVINLPLPLCNITNRNEIIFNEFTQLKYLNYIISYNTDIEINLNDLFKFVKYFPSFITEIPDELPKDNSFIIRYKKVSGFVNLDKIMATIDKLKESDLSEKVIINKIMKNFNKTFSEVKKLLKEWQKKYFIYKNSKIDSEFKTGIKVIITNKNIKLHGITNISQIVYTYNFFITFIYLFINKDKFNFKNIKLNNENYYINNISNELLLNYTSNNKYTNLNLNFNKDMLKSITKSIDAITQSSGTVGVLSPQSNDVSDVLALPLVWSSTIVVKLTNEFSFSIQ
jgi:hypothetical protein